MSHVWMRAETKSFEKRVPLVPEHVAELIKAGHRVTVEESSQSVFGTQPYREVGCEIVASGSWRNAPLDATILAVKEFPETDRFPLIHRHIHFAHVYKYQHGWKEFMARFKNTSGLLYDLEFLTDDAGRRIAAFGFSAGVMGAAVAVLIWIYKQKGLKPPFQIPLFYDHETILVDEIKQSLADLKQKPRAIVIGALGRVGRGAKSFLNKVGIETTLWDQDETKKGGPFPEILDYDIFCNAIFLGQPIPPLLTKEILIHNKKLSVIADISCDPTSPHNPISLYDHITTFKNPTVRVSEGDAPVDLIAIDHLPSFLPRESSLDYSTQFFPHLKNYLDTQGQDTVWSRAENLFHQKMTEAGC